MSFDEHIQIGLRLHGGRESSFGLSPDDLRHHLYIIGKSGTGKTTLLFNLILQAIERGSGIGVIDPHGDLALDLINHIPRRRIEETVYFDPSDEEFPIGFNVLKTQTKPHLIASGIVGALKGIWHESWGPRLEYILYAAIAALLECENVTILGLQRMLSDARYRAWVVKQVTDPVVRSYWVNEFASYDKRFVQEAIAPIQNKVGQLLMSPLLRNILGQVRSTLDARFMMDDGRIFIANLAKGKLGEDKSNLLGALLVTQFQLAAMSRADVPQLHRRDFRLFVDEFQSFSSESFASILSEARKYRLGLVLSHQYIEQVSPEIRNDVFGNVGSLISFRVGQSDAEVLEREFGRTFPASRFTGLSNHEILTRPLWNGENIEAFAGRTVEPFAKPTGRAETIIDRSRLKYATRREVAEDRIRRWFGEYPA